MPAAMAWPVKPFGVSDHNLVRAVTKDVTQRMDLRRSAAAARGSVSFVGDENRLRSDLMTANAAAGFRFAHQVLHHLADVLHVETSAVKRAISGHRAQHFADGLNAPFAGRLPRSPPPVRQRPCR